MFNAFLFFQKVNKTSSVIGVEQGLQTRKGIIIPGYYHPSFAVYTMSKLVATT